jgi:predicted aldo/keto reductase-like oxidoreductase
MIYRDFQGLKLSGLGMGMMRLPVRNGQNSDVDEEAVFRMVDTALENGINYFDTAWSYHGGNSELVAGKALSRHPREKYCLADKFPGFDLRFFDRVGEIFEEQLRKDQTEYFDFYLCHNVNEGNVGAYLDDAKYGAFSYFLEQKRLGRIRHLGLSAHGGMDVLRSFLDAFGEHIEFCQLQLNWLDWEFQHAKEKVELLRDRGIPVWVMEPLRGGKLVKLPEEDAAVLKKLRPEEPIPAWSFRFLQSIPDVKMILSGMSDETQLQDNLRTFETDAPLDEKEMTALLALGRKITARTSLPCTACRYCTEGCPMELDIPRIIAAYNGIKNGDWTVRYDPAEADPSLDPGRCVACGSCASICPQGIAIPDIMGEMAEMLKGR